MTMIRETVTTIDTVDSAGLAAVTDLLRSLSEPARLSIVEHLFHGEHRVTDLVAHLHLAQSTVSAHVACLRDCGLLSARVRGRATYYSLAEPVRTKALLDASAVLADATGLAAASCSTLESHA